jgi:hypothetical protein
MTGHEQVESNYVPSVLERSSFYCICSLQRGLRNQQVCAIFVHFEYLNFFPLRVFLNITIPTKSSAFGSTVVCLNMNIYLKLVELQIQVLEPGRDSSYPREKEK